MTVLMSNQLVSFDIILNSCCSSSRHHRNVKATWNPCKRAAARDDECAGGKGPMDARADGYGDIFKAVGGDGEPGEGFISVPIAGESASRNRKYRRTGAERRNQACKARFHKGCARVEYEAEWAGGGHVTE